jgi:hypothetical protein
MSSDRLLSHKDFHMALYGTPSMEAELVLDGAGTELTFTSLPGRLLMLQNVAGGVCFVSVGTSDEGATEPYTTGIRMVLGDKLMIFTKEDKTVIRAVDNGATASIRIFGMS